jgi:hypothetical protein
MASLRRNKTLSPDGQTARFLYTIIKQLDLKAIDWNMVAGSLEITNGHAARMRYSRFKQHMEGVTTQPRAPRRGGKKEKGGKEGKEGLKKGKKRAFEEDGDDKAQAASYVKKEIPGPGHADVDVKMEGGARVKNEPITDPAMCDVQIKSEPGLQDDRALSEAPPTTSIKREPDTDTTADSNPDIWRVLPHTTANPGLSTLDKTVRSTTFPTPVSTTTTTTAAAKTHASNPAHLRASFPPHYAAATVSLADLEVSPRSLPSAIAPGHVVDARTAHHNFATGSAAAAAAADSAEPRSLERSTAVMQIKAEPGLEDGLAAVAVAIPDGEDVLVKMEPMEF